MLLVRGLVVLDPKVHSGMLMGPEQLPQWHAEPEPLASDHSRMLSNKH